MLKATCGSYDRELARTSGNAWNKLRARAHDRRRRGKSRGLPLPHRARPERGWLQDRGEGRRLGTAPCSPAEHWLKAAGFFDLPF
jgi:hypothetical protein